MRPLIVIVFQASHLCAFIFWAELCGFQIVLHMVSFWGYARVLLSSSCYVIVFQDPICVPLFWAELCGVGIVVYMVWLRFCSRLYLLPIVRPSCQHTKNTYFF